VNWNAPDKFLNSCALRDDVRKPATRVEKTSCVDVSCPTKYPSVRSRNDYELRKTRRRTRFSQNKAGPLPGNILHPPLLSIPTSFLYESHCLLWSPAPTLFSLLMSIETSSFAYRTTSKDDCGSME